MTVPLGAAMEAEIGETARVAADLIAGAGDLGPALRERLPDRLVGVATTARGSSDHAANYGRYLLEPALSVPVWSTAPSLVTRYGAHPRLDGVLAIAVSQSGRTPEIVTLLERSRAGGAVGVAITNDPDSPLAAAADVTIPLRAGPERAVPATKTFTATLLAFALLTAALDESGRFRVDGPAVEAAIAEALASVPPVVEELAGVLAGADIAIHLGRGVLLPIAGETALKLIETTATAHLAWSTVDVRHGPVALATPGRPVVLHHARGPVTEDAAEDAATLRERGVDVWVVGDELPGARATIPVPGDLPEHLRPLVHAVRLQQLALATARARGVDPDQPPGLSKVTPTT